MKPIIFKQTKLQKFLHKAKEYTIVLTIAAWTIFGIAILNIFLTSTPKQYVWPTVVNAEALPTPTPITMEGYVQEKFGSDAWRAFAILHGTKYCGGENGRYNPEAVNTNTDGSHDKGYWQFNDKFHPEVSEACAKDIKCSTDRAYEIYKRDGDFRQWSSGKCQGL